MLACVEFEGEERVVHAHAQGRGVLLFTGHFGFWEINALVHALTLKPMAVLARPLDNPLLHDLLESVRTSTGNTRHLPARRDPPGAARARAEPGGRVPDRSAHADRPTPSTSISSTVRRRRRRRWRRSRCGRARPSSRCSRCRCRAAGSGWSTSTPVEPPAADDRAGDPRSSRSAAPTCSRCTCADIRSCGCGCTAAGATCPAARQ